MSKPDQGAGGELVRRRVVFSGRVQGVFFRATSRQLAAGYAVTGFVRNLPDSTVEMEVQGPLDQIDAFLAAVRRHYAENITAMDVQPLPVQPEETGFRIRY